jgi:O-glycosyl hydrolase
MMRTLIVAAACAGALCLSAASAGAQVSVTVDCGKEYQVIEGFGASTTCSAEGDADQLGAMRKQVLEAIYAQVKLNIGDLHCGPYEGTYKPGVPKTWENLIRANDNDDPRKFDWTRFTFLRSDAQKTQLYDIIKPMGFDTPLLRGGISTRWADQWLAELKKKDYKLYLDECAENAVAVLVRWREQYGIVPRWHQLFNEPTSGNHEVVGADTREIVDLVKVCGARFRAEGFKDIMMVVPSEETEEKSLEVARAILADDEARQYVGAIGYHCYPYGSDYCSVPRILAASGKGHPPASRIKVREGLRDLAAKYKLQLWMTEVSHGEANAFDTMRGRAIHIHDELVYANASSYWCMFNMGPVRPAHGGPPGEDSVVLYDTHAQTFRICGIGYAIGHYARWLSRGAVRVEAASGDPLVQATAFRDKTNGVVLVLINNRDDQAEVTVSVKGVKSKDAPTLKGEQSSEKGYWQALDGLKANSPTGFSISLPPRSVTSIAAGM